LVFVGFVDLGEFFAEVVFGDVGTVGVENVAVRSESDEIIWMRGSGFAVEWELVEVG
jgi:hypothetical protein